MRWYINSCFIYRWFGYMTSLFGNSVVFNSYWSLWLTFRAHTYIYIYIHKIYTDLIKICKLLMIVHFWQIRWQVIKTRFRFFFFIKFHLIIKNFEIAYQLTLHNRVFILVTILLSFLWFVLVKKCWPVLAKGVSVSQQGRKSGSLYFYR